MLCVRGTPLHSDVRVAIPLERFEAREFQAEPDAELNQLAQVANDECELLAASRALGNFGNGNVRHDAPAFAGPNPTMRKLRRCNKG
jgi:hypothetical protein